MFLTSMQHIGVEEDSFTCHAPHPVASTRVQGGGGGGGEALRGWGLRRGSAPSQKILLFFISKWHILVNSEVLNLKYM